MIGIAGGPEKCRWLMDELGVDAAVDYKNEDIVATITGLCPAGPDVFFDNVGGDLLDSLLPHLGIHARIVICGQMSQYDNEVPGDGHRFRNLFFLFMRRMRMEGFVVPDFAAKYGEIDAGLAELHDRGQLKDYPHVLNGLEAAADGLDMLQTGANRGKLIVRVSSQT